jgi:hypothetical protein
VASATFGGHDSVAAMAGGHAESPAGTCATPICTSKAASTVRRRSPRNLLVVPRWPLLTGLTVHPGKVPTGDVHGVGLRDQIFKLYARPRKGGTRS